MHRVAKQIAIFLLVVSVAATFVACNRDNNSSTAKGDSAVAATVNGKNILMSEVERIISQQAQGKESQMSTLELAAARIQVLDGLIREQVLFQRAEKENLLPKDEEVTQSVSQAKQQARMTEEEWQKALKESGQTEETLREQRRKQIAIQKLQEKTVGKISISDREVEDFYNNNKQSFVSSRGVGLSAFIVDPRDNGLQDDAKSEPEAKLKVERIYAQLKSGADFASVARASSEDQTNVRGGDLGFATEDDLKQNGFTQDLISNFFNTLQIGSYTSPVQFNGRWYIFKLTQRQLQNENLTIDSPGVRDRIKEALINQHQTVLNAALLATAMNEAKIENKLAMDLLNDPNSLKALRPVSSGAGTATTTASPAATVAASPATTAATPAAAATTTATPAASPVGSPR